MRPTDYYEIVTGDAGTKPSDSVAVLREYVT